MTIVLLTSDLMVVSRVQGAAMQAGSSIRPVADSEQAISQCEKEPTDALIIDLAAGATDIESLVQHVRTAQTKPLTIIAFGPHVHEERLATARRAGCDEVISRGQFFAQLEAILGRRVDA